MTEIIEVFPWNNNFNTGIALIDEQHKEIVSLINQIASHLVNQSDIQSVEKIFSKLADYAIYHFQSEELIWEQNLPQFSYLQDHKDSHSGFITSLLELKAKGVSQPFQNVFSNILSFLTQWLAHHILDSDMRMSKMVFALQAGATLEEARLQVDKEMSGAIKIMLDATLSMYDCLCKRTLDLHKEIRRRNEIEAELRLASSVFDNTLEAICITNADSIIIDANQSFFETTGYQKYEVVGKHIGALKSGLNDSELVTSIWQQLNQNNHWSGEI